MTTIAFRMPAEFSVLDSVCSALLVSTFISLRMARRVFALKNVKDPFSSNSTPSLFTFPTNELSWYFDDALKGGKIFGPAGSTIPLLAEDEFVDAEDEIFDAEDEFVDAEDAFVEFAAAGAVV